MNAVEYNYFQANILNTMKNVCENHSPTIVTNYNKYNVVLISLEDYNSLEETSYLLNSPKNRKRLLDSIKQLDSGKGKVKDLIE